MGILEIVKELENFEKELNRKDARILSLTRQLEQAEKDRADMQKALFKCSAVKFNLNHTIKVRLTDLGKNHFKKKYGHSPAVDEKGFYQCRAWHFIQDFGEVTYLGCPIMFEMDIVLSTELLEPIPEQLAKETPAVKAFDSFLDPAELESMKK